MICTSALTTTGRFTTSRKYGSISQAAEALMNNQPNVSRTIKNLESELNCTLFVTVAARALS